MTSRERVRELLDAGLSQAEIGRRLGKSKGTVAYHARNLGWPVDERCNRRYDWTQVQRFHDEGNSVTECQGYFGFARSTWTDAVRRGLLTPRPHAMPIEVLLSGVRNRNHIKARLVAAGLKDERCELCGVLEWQGERLSFALHHVNGDGSDNRLENLQLLCPNCHSQTANFAGRNRRPVAR